MSWREQIIARILLILAEMFADDPDLAKELKNLRTAIQVAK